MSQLREFASMLVAAAVGCCALKMLLPEGKLEPVLRVLLSIFFLLCLMGPLRRLPSLPLAVPSFQAEYSSVQGSLAETYHTQLVQSVKGNLCAVIEARLKKFGIEGTNIEINVNMDEQGRIDINGVQISLPQQSASLKGQVESYVEGELELPCKVRIAGEEEQDGY